MKRSIAFLLAVIMCIGMIPATLLPVLAHGMGVGVNDVQNLSIDNAPNQKIPATVTVDGQINDTAWKSDEWETANQQYGVWDSTPILNPNFTYRYQLHTDYEFLYGIIEWDATKVEKGYTLSDYTIWINDGTASGHYTAKVVITNGQNFAIQTYGYGASEPRTFASYNYEKASVMNTENGSLQVVEFKVLLADILGKKITEQTDINLSSFVSAKIGEQYFYHPRLDAERDNTQIDLANKWEDTAVKVTQKEIYGLDGENTDITVNNSNITNYGVLIDGNLNEDAWKNYTTYGASGYETYRDYQSNTNGATKYLIADYDDVEYSTEYMQYEGEPAVHVNGMDNIWFHTNDVNNTYDNKTTVEFTPGCYSGAISYDHTCDKDCEGRYIENIPVKFKYSLKCDGTYVYGAFVVSLSAYNSAFYYNQTNDKGQKTYFKVMYSDNQGKEYGELELEHFLQGDCDLGTYSDYSLNKRTLTAKSNIKETGKDGSGNSIMPDGVGAYAKRIDSNTMVFEFCISFDAMNKATQCADGNKEFAKTYEFTPDKEISFILTVANQSTSATTAGPCAGNTDPKYNWENNPNKYGIHASSAAYFNHEGYYDVLGRKNTHRYTFSERGYDPAFTPGMANGTLNTGIFNGLIATDRFINAAYRQNIIDTDITHVVISNTLPAITANVGETIDLTKYSVVFDGDTTATTGITWKNGSTTITSYKVASKGRVELTATKGSKSKTIHVVSKYKDEGEYVLYEIKDMDKEFANLNALKAAGWTVPSQNGNVSWKYGGEAENTLYVGGNMYNLSFIYLPEWLNVFGDYSFTINGKVEMMTGASTTRWTSLIFRANGRGVKANTNYSGFTARVNTTSNGTEFVNVKNDGYYNISQVSGTIADRTAGYHKMRVDVEGNQVTGYVGAKKINTWTVSTPNAKGNLGIVASEGVGIYVDSVKVTIKDTNAQTVNDYGNNNVVSPGGVQYFDYDIFMDTEYLYGSAIVKKNGYDSYASTTKSTTFDGDDVFRLVINNGTAQWRDYYDYSVKFYLDPDSSKTVSISQPGNTYHSAYKNGPGTKNDDVAEPYNMEKGTEVFNINDTTGIQFARKVITPDMYDGISPRSSNYASGGSSSGDGEMVLIEFKIPLEQIGVSEKYSKKLDSTGSDIALNYYVVVDTTGATDGLISPIPDNIHISSTDDPKWYVDAKLFAPTMTESLGGTKKGAWVTTNYSGVDGAHYIRTTERTNTFVIDGVLGDVIWNDEEERIWVNSTTGSWGNEPEVEHLFDYQYKIYNGRECIYGMADIGTVAEEDGELEFTLWVKNDKDSTVVTPTNGANKAYRIVQRGDHAVCYDLQGNEYALTRTETRWQNDHKTTFTLEITEGKVAMTNDGSRTYVEFMFSLEGMEVVRHEKGENVYYTVGGKGENGAGSWLPGTDKFYYYWGDGIEENKKLGFEYFVSVKKTCKEHPEGNTLYYPSTIDRTATTVPGADADMYCHLNKWDASNAYTITSTGYYVPETVTVDGDLTDTGWDDDRWIYVEEGVNGNLQNVASNQEGCTPLDYKYQIRVDHEYVYVAVVMDVPASPIRYDISSTNVHYSVPQLKFWIQSGDKDYGVTVTQKNGETKTYNYEDAISFTHLYDLQLAYDKEGKATETTFNLVKDLYEPDNYVTWHPNNAYRVGTKTSKVNDAVNSITYSGTTLRATTHDTGFYAPYGGNPRKTTDPMGVTSYKIGTYVDGELQYNTIVDENTNSKGYLTNHEATNYEDSSLFGYTKVIEENTVTAQHADGATETPYTDKDWYAKPEVKGYIYGNEHGVMTSDPTGTKTNVEFRISLEEIGCEDGDDFEYIVQASTIGTHTDTGYVLTYPPLNLGFDKADGIGSSDAGKPYWYWSTNAVVVDDAERHNLFLNNSFGPVSGIGAQYQENFMYKGPYDEKEEKYLAMKFGVMYNSDYIRQPADKSGKYTNASYWDVKEIGMLVGYTDSLKNEDQAGYIDRLTTENVDNYDIYRMESDVILDQIKGTNMADYENYIYYAIQLLWPEDIDTKLTYRGFVEYYPSDQIYYNMANRVFGESWTYSTDKDGGQYSGGPLKLEGVNGDPTKIPANWTFRETYYSEPITRSKNMIDFASTNSKVDVELPDTNKVTIPGKVEGFNGTELVYVPIDNRPVNLDRVKYQAEAAGFKLITPPDSMMSAMLDSEADGASTTEKKSDQGNPNELYEWLYDCFYVEGYKYYVLSVDEMLSGGLVGSREPFGDTDGDSIANRDSLVNFGDLDDVYTSEKAADEQGYVLSADEVKIINLLSEIAKSPDTYTVFFDTVKRLASTNNYASWDIEDYNLTRGMGGIARKQLYGSELTIENIVMGYNKDENGKAIITKVDDNTYKYGSYTFSAKQYQEYMTSRERKLRIADALYPDLVKYADTFYVGYDDSKPYTTMQTNEGRYIEEKLLKGSTNTYIFAGTDELGMMGIADFTTHIYGSVSANVEFVGVGKDLPGDDYDTGTLYKNVMTHINGIGATYSYSGEGDVDIFILTRQDVSSPQDNTYTTAELNALIASAKTLIDRVEDNLAKGRPTIVIDCAFKDGYLATMMMQRASTSGREDISTKLTELLAYSHWGTTANSLGIAISGGISRYAYLSNSATVSENSNIAAVKGHVESWVKDYVYRTGDVGVTTTFNADHPYNGSSVFATEYNNFWELAEYVVGKLNSSKVVTGIDSSTGKTVVESGYQSDVSDLGWRWDRYHEANYTIDVVKTDIPAELNYNDRKVTNLALGKSYKTSWSWDNSTWGGDSSYEDYCGHTSPNGVYTPKYVPGGWNAGELTNGVRVYPVTNATGEGNKYWAGWSFVHPDSDNFINNGYEYFDITIDLGAVYPVYQVNLDNLSRGLKNGSPISSVGAVGSVELWTSTTENGEYELQRTVTPPADDTKAQIYRYYLGTNCGAVEARYIKVRVYRNTVSWAAWFMCSEIEVLGIDPTRAEYIDSHGMDFDYSVTGHTPYIVWYEENKHTGADSERMTEDDGERLKMYYKDSNNYSQNMVRSDLVFANWIQPEYSRLYQSGWWLKNTGATSMFIDLDLNGAYAVSQVSVHMGTYLAGISYAEWVKLYLVDPNGNKTLVPTNTFHSYIFNGDTDKDGSWNSNNGGTVNEYQDKLEGERWTLEVKDEVLMVPAGYSLSVEVGRNSHTGTKTFIFTGIQVIGRSAADYIDDVNVEPADATVSYEFLGDNADKAGFAQGMISVTPVTSVTNTGNYLIYYTDDNGVLEGYDEIASIPITGSPVSYEIPDGIMIPEGATGIAVFESSSAFLDNAPDISTAVATRVIPAAKRLSLGQAEAVFGAASDVHMNYDNYYDCDAQGKWEDALSFFDDNGAQYVIVTGDMTGDDGKGSDGTLASQYQSYQAAITASGFTGPIYESLGNHGALQSDLDEFYQYTQSGNDSAVHYPDGKTNSPYYYVVKGKNVFVFMHLELINNSTVNKDNQVVISDAQIAWLETTLETYDNDNYNVFVICHSPFLNYGAGDVYNGGGYTDLLKTTPLTTNINVFKALLQEHRNVVVMSGHTHLTFYDGANYSDVSNEFAHTVHISSTCWPRGYAEDGSCPAGTDGRKSADSPDYGSEAYLVEVYSDYIVYTGYNLSTGKIIPGACIIIPTKRSEAPAPEKVFEGSGTAEDPFLIQDEQDFLLFASGMNANNNGDLNTGYGAGKYFLQTADIDLSNIDAYIGTYAGYTAALKSTGAVMYKQYKPAFSGVYNGNGYTITVNIDADGQRSVFPYVYGTIVNTTIKGSITGSVTGGEYNSTEKISYISGSAQPIRSVQSGANVINCIFDLDLTAYRTVGAVNSHYGYMYNVYTTGELNKTYRSDAVRSGTGTAANTFYQYATEPTNAPNSKYGVDVKVTDISAVATAFNDRSSDNYTTAMSKLTGGITLCNVSVVNGELLMIASVETEVKLFDNSHLAGNQAYTLKYAPYVLDDTDLFSNTVVTEISFPYGGLNGKTVSDSGLYFPVYVIKKDFTTKKEDCTVANGKKVILDLTGKLNGVNVGDWVTVSGLNISVGADETLAFGDTDMVVLPQFLQGDATYGFVHSVFNTAYDNTTSSLLFTVKGYGNNPAIPSINDGKKTISFVGDSISTYTGWSNSTDYNSTIGGNAVWYPNTTHSGADLAVSNTWWYRATTRIGYELCVNNSYSGSEVKDVNTYDVRAKNLHNTTTNTSPDIVVIFMGINDCAADTAIGSYTGIGTPAASPTTFSEAYGRLIYNIQKTYPGVEIYCCTILPDEKRAKSDNETEFNGAIRTIAKNMGVKVIDLYSDTGITASNISNYTVDKLHPNATGMQLIANVVTNAIN